MNFKDRIKRKMIEKYFRRVLEIFHQIYFSIKSFFLFLILFDNVSKDENFDVFPTIPSTEKNVTYSYTYRLISLAFINSKSGLSSETALSV